MDLIGIDVEHIVELVNHIRIKDLWCMLLNGLEQQLKK
jgi:hypothetical protein